MFYFGSHAKRQSQTKDGLLCSFLVDESIASGCVIDGTLQPIGIAPGTPRRHRWCQGRRTKHQNRVVGLCSGNLTCKCQSIKQVVKELVRHRQSHGEIGVKSVTKTKIKTPTTFSLPLLHLDSLFDELFSTLCYQIQTLSPFIT